MPAWLVFAVSATAVVAAGIRLAKDGDIISEETGLGGMWVGAILVAAATSLPELMTDSYAVVQGNPNLALGDLFGSSMANMAILACADLVSRETRMFTRVVVNQALVGSLAIALTAVAALGVFIGSPRALLGLGVPSVVIGFFYVAGMRVIHQNRPEPPFSSRKGGRERRKLGARLQHAIIGFVIAGIVILVAARYVAGSAADLASQFGISTGFVGLLLLAFTTSLPEFVVSVECVRRKAYDLAVGNLLGSNCFNMAVIVPLDVLNGGVSILARPDPALLIGAMVALLLMGLAVFEILNRSERRIWILEPGPVFMLLAYGVGLYFAYGASR